MKICVLQPDYSTSDVDYQHYDPPRDLSQLMPEATFNHVFLNKLTTYSQLKELKKNNYDIYVNLCEGYLEWTVPSIDVIYALGQLNLPYTGPTALLYDPPKTLMKYVAYTEGIHTPEYALLESAEQIEEACKHLAFPLFVKPSKAGDSLGIDENSLVHDMEALKRKVYSLISDYNSVLVEEYILGREFTVMVAAGFGTEKNIRVFQPVEYVFPKEFAFKTYSLKTSELHPDANVGLNDPLLAAQLMVAAEKIFNGFNGVGYGRLDFRMKENGDIYFLEINFTCSVFYKDGFEGSADHILKLDGFGQENFLRHIIAEGIYRHQSKQKKFHMKGNSLCGYGIYASNNIQADELIFKGEEQSQRIVSRSYVMKNWNIKEKEMFRRYAYPLSKEVFLLWDEDPAAWAPQNHSCNPNTHYVGLNVIASRYIEKGEELTLDYASFLDENMEPFLCKCGFSGCRGKISGIIDNSVTERAFKN